MTIHVLIVEDESITARDLKDIVEHFGYVVSGIAADYSTACDILESKKPDIALIDIRLKGEKTGLDLGEHIRAEYSMPLVFLTAQSDAASIRVAKDLGANGYIIKPYSDDSVFAAIETAFGNYLATEDSNTEASASPEGPSSGGLSPATAKRLEARIAERLSEDLRLDDLAALAKLSRFHFSVAFKETFGMPPYRYITEKRVAAAKVLLSETERPIIDIGCAVGYENQGHFTTVFRRETGWTPAKYRRDHSK